MADYNGTAFASAGISEWGFIPVDWKLAVPAAVNAPANFTINTSPFANDATREIFLKANYRWLTTHGIANDLAFFSSMLRLHVATRGTLATALANRAVIEDEYVDVLPANADWADVANNIPHAVYNPNVVLFIKRYADAIIHMAVYVFLARGHHWRPEFNELYDRLKIANFIPTNPGFAIPSNEHLFRLIIHAFGIRPLYGVATTDAAAGHVTAAMQVRFAPHAPIAGCAQITTLRATISQMSKEAWWTEFFAKFQADIAIIDTEVAAIGAHPTQYHVSARVLGEANRTMISGNSKIAFDRLCQFALGYIDHLGKKHPLSGQQAISKQSGGMTGLAEAFSRACDRFGKPNVDVDTMATFLAQT